MPRTNILHEPHKTGGGAASICHDEFMSINTVLGDIATSTSGAYHAFGFVNYATP